MFDDSKEQVSRKGAKTQRKTISFASLRALRETSFLGSQAPALAVIHNFRRANNAVIPAGMQESSAMDGNLKVAQVHDLGNEPSRRFTSL